MHMRTQLLRLLAAVVLLTTTAFTHATTIDFEGGFKFADGIGSSFDVGDYRFTLSGGAQALMVVTNQNDIVESNTYKLFATNHSEVTLSRVDGGLFDLLSFDLGGSFDSLPNRWASAVTATSSAGNASGVPSAPNYVNVAANLLAVDAVSFIPTVNANGGANNHEFTLDNIVVAVAQSVPAPSALLVLLLAPALLRRR